jgi:integrin alpha 8
VDVLICSIAGQVITVSIADIIANYSFKDILRKLAAEKQTDVAPASYDDSYLGKNHCSGTGSFSEGK